MDVTWPDQFVKVKRVMFGMVYNVLILKEPHRKCAGYSSSYTVG